MSFNPTEAERDPNNWNPDQVQAWKSHQQEQFARGLKPFPPDQFMLVHHQKFGLDAEGKPIVREAPPADQQPAG